MKWTQFLKEDKLTWGILIAYFILGIMIIYFSLTPTDPFKNYSWYYSKILTGIGVVMALIGVLTVFYLGKSHDYIHDFVKYNGIIGETVDRLEVHNNDPKLDHLQKEIEDAKKLNETFDNEEDNKILLSFPKLIIKISLVGVIVLVLVASHYIISTSDTIGQFIISLSELATLIVIFILSWLRFDQMISLFHKVLRLQVECIRSYKKILNQLELK